MRKPIARALWFVGIWAGSVLLLGLVALLLRLPLS